MDMDGLEGKGEGGGGEDEDDGATLSRSGDGGVLYDCRYSEARDSGWSSATLHGLAEGGTSNSGGAV